MCRSKKIGVEANSLVLKTIGATVTLAFLALCTPQFVFAQGNGRGKGNSLQQREGGSKNSENQSGRKTRDLGKDSKGNDSKGNQLVDGTLTPALMDHLIRMREEEKLAHDVYMELAQSSGLKIFNNIANAESQHMRAVEQLASRYSPAIASAALPVGSFSNPQFQALYKSLVTSGRSSPLAAIMVGLKIEEMDIKDLQSLLSQNPPRDVSQVLEHLQQGSKNHLRAFAKELKQLGGTYSPQFLNQLEFNNIILSENEQGQGAGKGMGQGNGRGMHLGGGPSNSSDQQMSPQSQKGNGKRGGKRK